MPHDDYPLTLLCHPATPAPVVRALEARVSLRADGALLISYRLWGDMARLRIAPEQRPEQSDLLWEHTCFEAFFGAPGETAYREFNFSPSGQWASFAFSDYRQRDEMFVCSAAPQIATRRFAGRLELDVTIARHALPANASVLGLAAVIEAADIVDGSHSYWALKHPAARPDFHHRDAFILKLDVPRPPV